MFRWKYILPRLAALAVLAAGTWMAMNPLLRWALIRSGQATVGARVEISKLESLIRLSQLQLHTVAVADPKSPMQNLLEAETAVLDVDVSQLLRKRIVIDSGQLQGLQFGTPRSENGSLTGKGPEDSTGPTISDRLTEAGEEWLTGAADKLELQLENDLQSVQLGQQLMQRWPSEFTELEGGAKSLHERGKLFVDAVQETKRQPLQSIEHYQRLMNDYRTLQQDTLAFQQHFSRLREQLRADRHAIEEAKQHDWHYVQDRMELAKLEPSAISQYLLGDTMGPQAAKLIYWLQWARQQLPTQAQTPAPGDRGRNVWLPGMESEPALLVRQMLIDGGGSAGGSPFHFEGTVRGLTNQPTVYGKPAEIEVSTSGGIQMLLKAVLDHTGKISNDRITIQCPQLLQPERTLGDRNQLAVNVAPGTSSFEVDLGLAGDDLNGIIRFQQPSVNLTTDIADKLGGKLVADRMSTVVEAVDNLQAEVRIGGTLKSPSWQLESNLGARLASGLNAAFAQEVEHRQAQLIAKATDEIDSQLAQLESRIAEKQSELLGKLAAENEQLQLISEELSRLNLPQKLIGRGGLLKKLLR